jgi:uncharacterized membrane protein
MRLNIGTERTVREELANQKSIFSYLHSHALHAGIIAFIFVFIYISFSLQLQFSYNTYAFDLGLFSQSLKYTLNGNILYHTMGGLSHLAYHFSPVLLLLAPFYWIFPHVETLLVAQAMILGVSGCLVYILCRSFNLSHRLSLAVELLFFVNPLLWGLVVYDFHEVLFAVPGILLLFLGIKSGKWRVIIPGLILVLTTKEDVIIATGAFAIMMIVYEYLNKRKTGIVYPVIALSAICTYGLAVGISAVASEGNFPRILTYGTVRFEYMMLPFADAVKGALNTFFSLDSLILICTYLAPLGFLPLFSWQWAFSGLLILVGNMFSTCPNQHSGIFQSATPALPFLLMGLIATISKWKNNTQFVKIQKELGGHFSVYFIILLFMVSVFFVSHEANGLIKSPGRHEQAINQVLTIIPDGSSVTVANQIFPHICDRTEAYIPRFIDPYTPITDGDWGYPDRKTQYIVVDNQLKQMYIGGYWEDIIQPKLNQDYVLITEIDGTKLFSLRE